MEKNEPICSLKSIFIVTMVDKLGFIFDIGKNDQLKTYILIVFFK